MPQLFHYFLAQPATTSAVVLDATGALIRTLWSAVPQSPGTKVGTWNSLDDNGNAAAGVPPYKARILSHNVTYNWEGVIGNLSSSFTSRAVSKSFGATSGISISGSNLYVSVYYNEAQYDVKQFALSDPNTEIGGILVDPFIAPGNIATDGTYLYWASTGGISSKRFVSVNKLSDGSKVQLSSSTFLQLNPPYTGQNYYAIDIGDHSTDSNIDATGIAVNGTYIAVAHGGKGYINLYNVSTGAFVVQFNVASMAYRFFGGNAETVNQIAFSSGGDLWVISGTTIKRYTSLSTTPTLSTTISGFNNPIAVATDPSNDNWVWVADGGTSQQVFKYHTNGTLLRTLGTAGGYSTDPTISSSKFFFTQPSDGTLQITALCVDSSDGIWVADSCNNRTLHFNSSSVNDHTMAWWPASYHAAVDHSVPTRVFLNWTEFQIDYTQTLTAGVSSAWSMIKNWWAGQPFSATDGVNGGFSGFQQVETLSNGRTYAVVAAGGGVTNVYELPSSGLLRAAGTLPSTSGITGATGPVMQETGDLYYIVNTGAAPTGTQTVYKLPLTGFDGSNNPQWGAAVSLCSVTMANNTPWWHSGGFSAVGQRFPVTNSGKVIFFDPTTNVSGGNEGMHLGAVPLNGTQFLWQAAPTGALDYATGKFQTKTVDGSVNYGGNEVWVSGRNIFYGYHGEGYTDLFYTTPYAHQVGEANQFFHYLDDGLFVGVFGTPNITHFNNPNNTSPPPFNAPAGMAGNSFSPTYAIGTNGSFYWYHNDESGHGGLHRWRIDGLNTISEQDSPIGNRVYTGDWRHRR